MGFMDYPQGSAGNRKIRGFAGRSLELVSEVCADIFLIMFMTHWSTVPPHMIGVNNCSSVRILDIMLHNIKFLENIAA